MNAPGSPPNAHLKDSDEPELVFLSKRSFKIQQMQIPRISIAALAGLLLSPASAQTIYPPTLANCTMEEKIAALAPAHVGVVWIEREGETLEDIRADFATSECRLSDEARYSAKPAVRRARPAVRSAGFTALKQLIFRTSLAIDEDDAWAHIEAVGNAALDAGLTPWWYGLGGWE